MSGMHELFRRWMERRTELKAHCSVLWSPALAPSDAQSVCFFPALDCAESCSTRGSVVMLQARLITRAGFWAERRAHTYLDNAVRLRPCLARRGRPWKTAHGWSQEAPAGVC